MILDNLGVGNSFNIIPISGELGWAIIQLLFVFIILIALLVYFLKMYQYKYWVLFLEKNGKDVTWIFDEAKVVKSISKGQVLYLKKQKRNYPLIDFKYKKSCRGGGLKGFFKKGAYLNFKYGEQSSTPIDFKFKNDCLNKIDKGINISPLDITNLLNENIDLRPIDSDIEQFNQLYNDTIEKTKPGSNFKDWMPLIITVGGLSVLVAMCVIMMIMLKDVNSSFQSAASSLSNTAKTLVESNIAQNAIEVAQAPGFGG